MIRYLLALLLVLSFTHGAGAQVVVNPNDYKGGAGVTVDQASRTITNSAPYSAAQVTADGFDSVAARQAALVGVVRSVNTLTPDGSGAVTLAIPSLSGYSTTTQMNTAIANAVAAVPTTTFAGGCVPSAPCTVATVLSATPCSATYVNQYAVVSNLYSAAGNTNEVLRCANTSSTYYWRPQRTDYAANVAMTGGTVTATCMVSAPTMFVSGTLLSNQTINLSATNCWPGAQFTVANDATLGLFGLSVTGLVGGLTKALGLGARGTFIYTSSGWQSL